jgi:hypothetical protein
MAELFDSFVYFLFSPVFAIVIGLFARLFVSVFSPGAAARFISWPFRMLLVGYAALGLAIVSIFADGGGGNEVGELVGAALSFALVLYLLLVRRRRRRRRAALRKADDRPRVARRSRGREPGAGGRPGTGDGRRTGAGNVGARWARGLPRPVARPPGGKPPSPGTIGPGGIRPDGFGPDDDTGPGYEPPEGTPPPR